MSGFFVQMDFVKVENGFILLKANKKILEIPSKVPKYFFDENLKEELKHPVIYDADIQNKTMATLVARDPRNLSLTSADWAIWSAYITGGAIFVKKEMLGE